MSLGGFPDPTTPWWTDFTGQYMPDAYGPIYGGHSVQQAIFNTLRKWLPTYITLFNRRLGGDILHIVPQYGRPFEDRPWASTEDVQIDCIVPGTVGDPQEGRTNDLGISSTWMANLEVFYYGGTDWQEVRAITWAYAVAARSAIVQHPDLEGFAQTTNWKGEALFKDKDESIGNRFSGIATINFEVYVSPTINQFAGPPSPLYAADGTPTEPTLLPIPDFPLVTQADIEVENETPSSEDYTP